VTAAFIDEVAVERAAKGERIRLTPAERQAAVAHLTRWGYSAAEIAERLGVTARTVERIRARLRTMA
jgi:DNA-binding NarL/FixJ family response regulator